MKRSAALALPALLAVALAIPAHALTISMENRVQANDGVGFVTSTPFFDQLAAEISIATSATLTDITIDFGGLTFASNATLDIYNAAGSVPGTSLHSLGMKALPLGASTQTWNSTPFSLVGGTAYWVVLTHVAGAPFDSIEWVDNTATTMDDSTLGSITQSAVFNTMTNQWALSGAATTPRMTINAVPEPTTAALLGLGLAGIALRRRLSA